MKKSLTELFNTKRYKGEDNKQYEEPQKKQQNDDVPPELLDALDNDNDKDSSSLTDSGVYYLRGDINERTITPILTSILEKDLTNFPGEIFLFVNSAGGDASEAWALIDLLHSTRIPITTIGLGLIASGGSMIVAAGDPGRRVVMARTEIMVHPFSAGIFGNFHNMKANMDGANIEYERAIKFWITHSVYRNKREVEKHLMKVTDNYMTPTQAVRHGIIDGIVKDQWKTKIQRLHKEQINQTNKKKKKKATNKKKKAKK